MAITFKIAVTEEEFEQIHRLNYQTFVQEIPQHSKNEQQRLVDRFHHQNTYLIACDGSKVVGMMAVRDQRPFSLDEKVPDLDGYLPQYSSACEIRLLAVEQRYRQGRTFFGLAQFMAGYCLRHNYDLVVMSGTVRQLKLYRQMGFVPFAALVGTEEALYQPMYLTRETYYASLASRLQPQAISFIPGPVPIRKEVAASLERKPISHRSPEFQKTIGRVRKILCESTCSPQVEILAGTGTLANDCIAAQLRDKGPGVVLANGEFGERLIDHARRAGLVFKPIQKPWGSPFDREELKESLACEQARWLWAVHGETSTGMLNDLEMFREICREAGVSLCLDAISTLGAMPVDLSQVAFASGVSGKGIGGYTGLSFVFHQSDILPSDSIPRYLDLGLYQLAESVPFSHSSNLLQALEAALEFADPERYHLASKNLAILRREVEQLGLAILVPEEMAMPYILTIQIPGEISSLSLGDSMASFGFKLHYESAYLRERNWLQISVIGREEEDIRKMLKVLKEVLDDL